MSVPHAEFLSHAGKGRTVVVFSDDESFSIIDLLLVTRLEISEAAKSDA
ncbi:MAG: hypothetical protein AAF805_01585 [Planctomycetota bacterium]